jgi:hypothetical protein
LKRACPLISGLVHIAEARLIGLERSDELARYLPASEVRRLGALVSEALVARLPGHI